MRNITNMCLLFRATNSLKEHFASSKIQSTSNKNMTTLKVQTYQSRKLIFHLPERRKWKGKNNTFPKVLWVFICFENAEASNSLSLKAKQKKAKNWSIEGCSIGVWNVDRENKKGRKERGSSGNVPEWESSSMHLHDSPFFSSTPPSVRTCCNMRWTSVQEAG